jgi:hypothetical protein
MQVYNVHGIPTLVILDSNWNLINRHGRDAVLNDPTAMVKSAECIAHNRYSNSVTTLASTRNHGAY